MNNQQWSALSPAWQGALAPLYRNRRPPSTTCLAGVTSLAVGSIHTTKRLDLSPLAWLPGLRELALELSDPAGTDFTPLARVQLRSLSIRAYGDTTRNSAELQILGEAHQLESLSLGTLRLPSLRWLLRLSQLERLELRYHSDMGGLLYEEILLEELTEALPELRLLRIAGSCIGELVVSLQAVAGCTDLEVLELRDTPELPIWDPRPLSGLHRLRELVLVDTHLASLDGLSGLPLSFLHVPHTVPRPELERFEQEHPDCVCVRSHPRHLPAGLG